MKIKKIILVLLMLLITACSYEDKMSISDIYTDEDIEGAIDVVKDYFQEYFIDCTFQEISYIGDSYEDEFIEYALNYEAKEAIILTSSFKTGESGGDGSLNQNEIYEDYLWILVRNENEQWQHVDHGY
ncbi:MAG: hypothetical protein LUG12_03295 [Erysipelotrichaceae bacterium]|nr:hypothetical protein [Erysipelotrichaceae bacterium]